MTRPVHSGAARWRAERRASETDSLLVEAHRHLERGHRDRARRVVKETLLTRMSLPEGLEVGRLLDLLDETQAAVDLLHTLLRQARSPLDRATVRVALLMVLGRYDEAVEPLRILVDRQPENAEAHLRLAQCFQRSGRDEPALAAIRRARQVAPDWPDMHLELGRLALRLGHIEDARVSLYRAWRIDPDDRRNTLAIAALWMRAHKPAEALPLYEHALEHHGASAQVLVEAGLAFARSDRIDAARACLGRLDAQHPQRRDAARRLRAAIDEAVAFDESVELDEDDLISVDGSLPGGFESLVPVPGKKRRLGDVTTGEVEAALGTLDLDISMDDFGSYDSYEGTGPIPPPLDASEDGLEARPPPAGSAATGHRPLAPLPAAVPPRTLDQADPGDSVERAFAELVFDGGPPDDGPPIRLGAAADADPPSTASRPAALLDPPSAAAGRDRMDEPPRLQADIASGGPGESIDDRRPAAPAPSGFALLGPPPDARRQTGPLPSDAALPPLMAFGSLSGDLSVLDLDPPEVPEPPFDSPRRPAPGPSGDARPLLAPRAASPTPTPAGASADRRRTGSPSGSGDSSIGSSSGDSIGSGSSSGARRGRRPPGDQRRFEVPPASGPTGPLPALPKRQTFAEMAVGQGLIHRGGDTAPEPRGRSRRGDPVRPGPTPGGPLPSPQAGAWGAAPRTDPLLTTSDALQRWRAPAGARSTPAGEARARPPTNPARQDTREVTPGQRLGGRSTPSLRSQTALLAGSQAVFWIPRILRFMEGGLLSGAVGLNAPEGQAEVQFRAGRLTGASASNQPTLAQVLQRPERLRPGQRATLGDLTWTAQDGESLLDRLVETGLFEAPNVNAAVIDQVFATASEVLRWRVGWFTLVAHADPPSRTGRMVKLPLAALLSGVEDDRAGGRPLVGDHLRPAAHAVRIDARLETRIRAQRQRVERAPADDRARLQLGQLLMRAEHYVQAIDVFMTGLSGSVDQRYVKLLGLAIEGLAQHGPREGDAQLLRIALCGRLGRIGMVQLLEMLGPERVTGTVRLIAHEGLAEVELVDGELAGATNSNTARLGDLMRASSIVTSDQIEALVARQSARERWLPLGRLAVESGVLAPDQMRGLLQKQVRLALLEAGRWRQAHVVVELAEPSGLRLQRDLDSAGILRDLRRMVGRTR